jgi:hypothetical protein
VRPASAGAGAPQQESAKPRRCRVHIGQQPRNLVDRA